MIQVLFNNKGRPLVGREWLVSPIGFLSAAAACPYYAWIEVDGRRVGDGAARRLRDSNSMRDARLLLRVIKATRRRDAAYRRWSSSIVLAKSVRLWGWFCLWDLAYHKAISRIAAHP